MEQSTIYFIQEVEKQECLYNSTLPQYSQRHATEVAWTIVATKCNMTVSECKEKWRNLRTTFTRKNKLPSAVPGGVKKPYYLHDIMKFIIPYIKPLQKSSGNTEASNSTSETQDQTNCSDTNEKSEPIMYESPVVNKRKKKNDDADREYLNYLQNQQASEETANTGAEDPRRLFLLSLMDEISEFNNSEMKSFKRKVLHVIDEIIAARESHYPYSVHTRHYSNMPPVYHHNNVSTENNQNESPTPPVPEEPIVKIEYLE